MILDSTLRKLQVQLGSGISTANLPVTVDWVDNTTTTFTPGLTTSITSGVTLVDILAAPASSVQRKVNSILISNADTTAKALSVFLNDNGTNFRLVNLTLQTNETLGYTDVQGWYVLDTSGAIKGAGPTGATGSPGLTGATGSSGPAGFGLDGEAPDDPLVIPGPQGSQGPQGTQGQIGIHGIGIDGEDGDPAPIIPGPPGPAGIAGATGSAGPAGFGLDGEDGSEGMPIPGNQGLTGPQGVAGITGPIGFGLDGNDGEDALVIPGKDGIIGVNGINGAQGATGMPGEFGEPGDDAPFIPGPIGLTGLTGATGSAGPAGFGLDGSDGDDGMPIPGLQGLQGPAGNNGIIGRDGNPGFGIDGNDGEDALFIPGPTGPQGLQGVPGSGGSGSGSMGPPGLDGELGDDAFDRTPSFVPTQWPTVRNKNDSFSTTFIPAENQLIIVNTFDNAGTIDILGQLEVLDAEAPDTRSLVQSSSLLVSGTSQNTTSGTSIDFTGLPVWVKRITFMLNGVSTNGTSIIQLQIGSGTIVATGYNSIASSIGASSVQTITSTTGAPIINGNLAVNTYYGIITIVLISPTIWLINGSVSSVLSTVSTVINSNITLAGVLDRVRLTTVNGTDVFDAGSVNILYE